VHLAIQLALFMLLSQDLNIIMEKHLKICRFNIYCHVIIWRKDVQEGGPYIMDSLLKTLE